MKHLPGPVATRASGVASIFAAYFAYAIGDAAAKWLVGSFSVWEVLCLRSTIALVICLAVGRGAAWRALAEAPARRSLMAMNLANFAGWAAYYWAARTLALPQLVTTYYLAPIIVALLAGPMLGERISGWSWAAAGLAFAGVVIGNAPQDAPLPSLAGALLGVGAAACWALSGVLYRRNLHGYTNLELVVTSCASMVVLGALPMALAWNDLATRQPGVLLVLAVATLAAHFFYVVGVRRVSVAVAVPIGFFSLIWAALLAYGIWGQLPTPSMMAGAAMILCAGLLTLGGELRRRRSDARTGLVP